MMDIVLRLREPIIADAFEAGRIQSGVLAERLMKERLDAADEIERLRMDAEEHDRLWAASGERNRQMFAELRRDLGLQPSRVDAKKL